MLLFAPKRRVNFLARAISIVLPYGLSDVFILFVSDNGCPNKNSGFERSYGGKAQGCFKVHANQERGKRLATKLMNLLDPWM
jgi:hypothetical protein